MQSVVGGAQASRVQRVRCAVIAVLLAGGWCLPRSVAAQAEAPRAPLVAPAAAGQVERRLPLTGWSGGVDNLMLLNLSGEDITSRLEPREREGKVSLRVTDTEPFIAKPRVLDTLALGDGDRTVLPGGFVVTVPDPSAPPVPPGELPLLRLVWFRVTAMASPMPAPWNEDAAAYRTRVSFGLKAPANSPDGLKLPAGVPIRLLFDGATAMDVEPFSLDQAGLEHDKTVELEFRPSDPSPKLIVRSSISDVNLELRAQPRLLVRPVHARALGLGLAPVDVNVERIAPHGAGLATNDATPLLLQIDGGARLDPSTPIIGAGESRTSFSLRSNGLGSLQIRASAGPYAGVAHIDQTFPFGPLLSVLLGGALGGFARRFVKGARRSAGRKRVVEGLAVSLIAFVAGVLGVNVIDALPANLVATEAGAFLTGALSGFAGVSVLEWLSRKKEPMRERAPA